MNNFSSTPATLKQSLETISSDQSFSNLLINSFPSEVRERLILHFQKVFLPAGHFLYQPDERLNNLYFPVTGIAVEYIMQGSGKGIQTAMLGRDAMPALSPFLSGNKINHFTEVLIGGEFLKIKAQILRDELNTRPALQQILLNQLDEHINQLSNALLCRAFHQIEQRLCRWLFMLAEKFNHQPVKFLITHQQIAVLLGVQRPVLSTAAKNLERQKIISYCRGKLSILDARQLQNRICEY